MVRLAPGSIQSSQHQQYAARFNITLLQIRQRLQAAADAAKRSRSKDKSLRKNGWGWHEGLPAAIMDACMEAVSSAYALNSEAFENKLSEVQNLYHFHIPWPHKCTAALQLLLPLNLYFPGQPPPIPENMTQEQVTERLEHIKKTNAQIRRYFLAHIRGSGSNKVAINESGKSVVTPEDLLKPPAKRTRALSAVQLFAVETEWSEEMEKRRVEKLQEFRAKCIEQNKVVRNQPPPNLKESVAREFFDMLPKEEQEEWEKKAKNRVVAAQESMPITGSPVAALSTTVPQFVTTLEANSSFRTIVLMTGVENGQQIFLAAEGNKNNADSPQSFSEFLGPEFNKLKLAFKTWGATCWTSSDHQNSRSEDPAHFGMSTFIVDQSTTASQQNIPTVLTIEEAKKRGWFTPIATAGKAYARTNKKRIPVNKELCFLYALRLVSMGRLVLPIDENKVYPAENEECEQLPEETATPTERGPPIEQPGGRPSAAATPRQGPRRSSVSPTTRSSPDLNSSPPGSRSNTPDVQDDQDQDEDQEMPDNTPSDSERAAVPQKRKANARGKRGSKKTKSRPDASLTITLVVQPLPVPTAAAPMPTLPIVDMPMERQEIDALESEQLDWLSKVLKVWFLDWTRRDAVPMWMALVELEREYVKLGRAEGRLGSKYRPALVAEWIQSARYDRSRGAQLRLQRQHLGAYVEEWHAWWRTLQPEWRQRGETSGPWDVLIAPGENGFLSVAATLWWWADCISKEEKEEYGVWVAAMTDVTRVMSAMAVELKRGDTVAGGPS